MDMSNQISRLIKHRIRRRKGDTAQLAAQLAPLEEQDKRGALERGSASHSGARQEYGAIVIESDNRVLSEDIAERRQAMGFLGMEPVVLVILGVMLTFIAFIAWQISQMPVE
jgi:cytochrome c-type biogenesis protein CcmH/NrfG